MLWGRQPPPHTHTQGFSVALEPDLEITLYTRLASNSQKSICLCLPSTPPPLGLSWAFYDCIGVCSLSRTSACSLFESTVMGCSLCRHQHARIPVLCVKQQVYTQASASFRSLIEQCSVKRHRNSHRAVSLGRKDRCLSLVCAGAVACVIFSLTLVESGTQPL